MFSYSGYYITIEFLLVVKSCGPEFVSTLSDPVTRECEFNLSLHPIFPFQSLLYIRKSPFSRGPKESTENKLKGIQKERLLFPGIFFISLKNKVIICNDFCITVCYIFYNFFKFIQNDVHRQI